MNLTSASVEFILFLFSFLFRIVKSFVSAIFQGKVVDGCFILVLHQFIVSPFPTMKSFVYYKK